MRKIFIGYYAMVVIIGMLLAINAIVFGWGTVQINLKFVLIMGLALVSETVYHFVMKNTSMTLSSAIIIFACVALDFGDVVIILFIFTLTSRVVGVIKKEFKNVFNMKWLFNFASFTILAKLVYFILGIFDFAYLKPIDQVIVIVFATMVHNLMNIVLTYTVISLSAQENTFKEFKITEYLVYTFYNIMFVILTWFGYRAYDEVALLLMGMLVVPLQKSIMIQSKSEEISKMLIEDSLTKANNRQSFEDDIYEKLEKKMPFSLIYIDLDRFKHINDTHGHLVGDEVLVDLVEKVRVFLRPKDKIYRFGGDEFCIITYDLGYGDILYEILRKNRGHFCIHLSDEIIYYTFTMSQVKYDGMNQESYRQLLQRADEAMYLRKQGSKWS
ncbi:GGDEF domain-containing protein [Fusibacter sp. JL216-2]|uniref:GGDEF domain-containing protein n=1 Tax=Fusibacter sp. JL216-2 TaxID=3071453 RepID=UPI003D340E0B